VLLDERDLQASFAEPTRTDLAGRPRADDHHVDVHAPTLVATVRRVDVTAETFGREVIERSAGTTVVVDFWAPWCGPCHILAPVLERAVAARDGGLVLAKVDVDANPDLADRYRIRGIPAVKAFRDGQVVAEFVGAQPPSAVTAFVDRLE
jgi:thioredoxin